jgi:hypothetical protein
MISEMILEFFSCITPENQSNKASPAMGMRCQERHVAVPVLRRDS